MNKTMPQTPPNGVPLRPPLRRPLRQSTSVETAMVSTDDAEKAVTRPCKFKGRGGRRGKGFSVCLYLSLPRD
jgi:hypothetical protein